MTFQVKFVVIIKNTTKTKKQKKLNVEVKNGQKVKTYFGQKEKAKK